MNDISRNRTEDRKNIEILCTQFTPLRNKRKSDKRNNEVNK